MQRFLFYILYFCISGYIVATHLESKIESDCFEEITAVEKHIETVSSVDTPVTNSDCKEIVAYVKDNSHGLVEEIKQHSQCDLTSLSQLQSQETLPLFNNYTRLYNYLVYLAPRALLYKIWSADMIRDNIVSVSASSTPFSSMQPIVGPVLFLRARPPGLNVSALDYEPCKYLHYDTTETYA